MTPTGGRSRTVSETNATSVSIPLTAADDCYEITILDETNAEGGRLPDVVAESRFCDDNSEPTESYLAITIQVFIPFLVAGLGMVGAGLVLDLVQVNIHLISILSTYFNFLLIITLYIFIFSIGKYLKKLMNL